MGVAEVVVLILTAPGMCLLLYVLARLEKWLDASEAGHPATAVAPVAASPVAAEPAPAGVIGGEPPEPGTLPAPGMIRTGPAGQAA